MKTVFARSCAESNVVRSERLFINNCGYYFSIAENMKIERPLGRVDYHLIYVHRGALNTNIGNVKAGEYLYYKPNTPQCYEYTKEEKSAYFWVHYSGEDALEILDGRATGIYSCEKNSAQIYELFLRMTNAIQESFYKSEPYALGIFQALSALICGGEKEKSPFSSVISMMHDLSLKYTVADYAERAKMSKEHFIRSFKSYTKKTPNEYRTDIMLSHAKNLLVETSFSVGAVAEMSGFQDALYFSRVFKNRIGISPSEFRKTMKLLQE